MRRLMHTIKLVVLAVVVLLGARHGAADMPSAAGMDEHTASMLRQHHSMLTTQAEWDKAKKAVKAGSTADAISPVMKMDFLAKDLDRFMLHKHPEKRPDFLKKAAAYKKLLNEFKRDGEIGDAIAIKKLIPGIDKACKGCHDAFR